jgi:outer membrane protein OmpA-like peptidoglycan-associated protein
MMFTLAMGLMAAEPGPAPQSWVQGKVAYVKPDSCNCIKDLGAFGLGAGTWFAPRWGYELDFLTGHLDSRHTSASAKERELQGALLYGLNPTGTTWFPYLRVGLGAAQVGGPYSLGPGVTNRFAFHEGIGVQGFLGKHLMTSLEARALTIDTQVRRTEKQALLGVGLRWGAPAAGAVSPAPGVAALTAPAAVSAPPPPPTPVAVPAPPPPPPPAAVPAPPPPMAAPAPVPAPAEPLLIVLDDATLHFANGKALLSPEGMEAIRQVARSLKTYAGTYDLRVTGHTSSQGPRAFNLALSQKRAEAVAAVLVAEGLPASRIQSIGKGPDQPIADNGTPQGQARNRRVEIELSAQAVTIQHAQTGLQNGAVKH